MESLFTNGWVQVVPSLWQETFGNVAAEAMMRGTAVVVSDSGGMAEFVTDGETGFVFPSGNVAALADILALLLLHPERIEAVGKKAHAFAKTRLSIDAMAGKYETVYNILSGKDTCRNTTGQ
jgi:glycosyltransferase involved in cell wall biosynthesis